MARPIGSARDSDPAFWDPVGRRLGGPRACVALLHLPARCICSSCSCQRHAAATTRRALALERADPMAVLYRDVAASISGLCTSSVLCDMLLALLQNSALREGDGCKHFSHQGIGTGLSDHQALSGSWGLGGLYLFPSCHPSCVAGGMLTLSSPRALTFRRASSGHVNSRYERGTCSRTL